MIVILKYYTYCCNIVLNNKDTCLVEAFVIID